MIATSRSPFACARICASPTRRATSSRFSPGCALPAVPAPSRYPSAEDVLVSYLSEEDDARETARWVEEAGRTAVLAPGDIGEGSALQGSRRARDDRLRPARHPSQQCRPPGKHREHRGDHVRGMGPDDADQPRRDVLPCRAAAPVMRPGSAIINTSSIQSKSPSPELLAYATTKGAVSNFTAGLAAMLAEKGIRVNAVAPGPIWTPLIPSTLPCRKGRKLRKRYTARAGRPAGRARRRLRAAGLRRGQLHLGRRHPRDGWKADAVRLRGGEARLGRLSGIFAPAELLRAPRRCREYSTRRS